MRIVFDTNVLFSAFTVHGACAGLYEECLRRAQIVVSPPILAELAEKLAAKARLGEADVRAVLAAVRADAEVVNPSPLPQPVCRDPEDDAILATALAAGADAIVTGDQDILVLKRHAGADIVSPRECLVRLSYGEA